MKVSYSSYGWDCICSIDNFCGESLLTILCCTNSRRSAKISLEIYYDRFIGELPHMKSLIIQNSCLGKRSVMIPALAMQGMARDYQSALNLLRDGALFCSWPSKPAKAKFETFSVDSQWLHWFAFSLINNDLPPRLVHLRTFSYII